MFVRSIVKFHVEVNIVSLGNAHFSLLQVEISSTRWYLDQILRSPTLAYPLLNNF